MANGQNNFSGAPHHQLQVEPHHRSLYLALSYMPEGFDSVLGLKSIGTSIGLRHGLIS